MSITPATTIEPGKRIWRTVISVIVGGAVAAYAVVPGVLLLLNHHIPATYYAEVSEVGGSIAAFSVGVNALLNLPFIVKILPSWLTPTAVAKTAAEITEDATELGTVVTAIDGAPSVTGDVTPIETPPAESGV